MDPATLFNAVYTLFSALISDFEATATVNGAESAYAHLMLEARRLDAFELENPAATMEKKIDCHVRMTAIMMALVYFDCIDNGIVDIVSINTIRHDNRDRRN